MLNAIRALIRENNLDAMLINSTNEFLVEYNSLEENARYALTGFSGSTGDAVVTPDNVYLFVDGRYHIQADNEVDHEIVSVVKLQNGDTFLSKLKEIINCKSRLGLVPEKNSQARIEELAKSFEIVYCKEIFFSPHKVVISESIEDLELKYTGMTMNEKLEILRPLIAEEDAILVTNLEEVSYLFNKRNFSSPYSSKINSRAVITKTSADLYSKDDFENYKNKLCSVSGKIYADKKTINGRDYEIIKNNVECFDKNVIAEMKSRKTDAEIEHYKECFNRTDKAVRAIRDYIENSDNISEYDIDVKLEEYFKKYGARSLSFKSIVAKDKNSALAHYSKASNDEIIKDGSLILIDCGAYYDGGLATDITRVFVKGKPSYLQMRVYTTVLKAFLNAFNTKISANTSGFDIDAGVRILFDKNPIEGFVFNHGLGHGIGVSVHEYPPNLSCNELAKVKLKENMCFTIEPGLYNKDYFGVRLENSCYLKNGKIQSFVHMGYEKKLIDYELLSEQEKEWLKDFEVI